MNLVNEKYIAFFKVSQQGGQITRFFDHRPAVVLIFAPISGYDLSERCFPQARGPLSSVVQCFAARKSGFNEDAQIVFDLLLADVFAQDLGRSESSIAGRRLRRRRRQDEIRPPLFAYQLPPS